MKPICFSVLLTFLSLVDCTSQNIIKQSWVKINFGNQMPADAFIGGKDSDGAPLYVAHANYNGNWHPGKTRKEWNGANLEYGGKEVSSSNYEVLIGNDGLRWSLVSGGVIPANVVVGGHENQNNLLICRCSYAGSSQLGKTWEGNNSCNIGYGGQGFNVPVYEVLVQSVTGSSVAQPSFKNSSGINVYITGYDNTMTSGNATNGAAYLWTNGRLTTLTDRKNDSRANALFVSGEDVYIAGTDGWIAKVWKNGVPTNLTDGVSSTGSANAVAVNGNDVYVAGVVGSGVITLWKNGVPQSLSTGSDPFATATSVYIKGADVYVTGKDGKGPKYWKNGIVTHIGPTTTSATTSAVVVNGMDVFVTGNENEMAKVWKNGVARSLSDGNNNANANSIFVSGDDVYVAGWDGQVAKFWKNYIPTSLSDGSTPAFAKSIFVVGKDVYIAGQAGNKYGYWKNGILSPLNNGSNQYPMCYISSIVVK